MESFNRVACLRDFNARRLILLFALSALCFLCDPLTLVELHLPLFVAALPLLRRRPSITPILVIMLAGAAAGHFLDVSLFARFLTREGGSDIEEASGKVGVISQHVLLWWHDMTIGRLIAWPLPVALLFLAAWGSTGSRWHGAALSLAKQPEQFSVFAFYRRFALAALSMTSLLAITLLYDRSPNAGAFIDYVDISWYRYLDTLFWWPMIIAAALLAAFLADLGLNRVILPAGLAALVCLVARLPDHWPMLATWRPMITDCLVENRTALGESSGLAAYWNARDVAASLDWAIEIDQILPDGRIMYWGNDPLVYRPRPGKQSYGFVIVKGLDEAAIRQNYGPPDQVLACPGSDVWIYRDTDRIQRRLYAEP